MTLPASRVEIRQFVEALFRYADEGTFISLRAFDQRDRGTPPLAIEGVKVNGSLDNLAERAAVVAERVANGFVPAVFAPPVATFGGPNRARSCDVANGVAISVELDAGEPEEAMQRLEQILGPATLVMASGGEIECKVTGVVQQKLHGHWRLTEPTRTPEEHAKLQDVRWLAAVLVGGDRTAAPPAHPLRWPGSWNVKAKPRMARILRQNDAAEVDLGEARERLLDAVESAGHGKSVSTGPRVSGEPEADLAEISSALAAIPNHDVHWDEWTRIGLATWRATGGAEEGFAAWRDWSAKSSKHDAENARARWDHFATSPPNKIGAGTIFFLARASGWSRPWRTVVPPEAPPRDELPAHWLGTPVLEPEVREVSAQRAGSGDRSNASSGAQGKSRAGAWPDPIDFLGDCEMTGAPRLQPHHLPDALAPFVFDTAARMGVDPAAVALAAVVSCASVASDAWAVQPKVHDDTWTENPRLWGAIVGDPSILKTPVLKACTRPIDVLEAQARDRHSEDMRKWKSMVAALKKEKTPAEGLPPQPRLDRYMVEGTTTEALTEVLRDDDDAKQRAPCGKILARQDEMSGWLGDMDRYKSGGKGGGDRAAYLTLFNGGRFTVDRIGRGSFAVSNWSACVLGGIQPEPIQRIAKEAADDGLLQRFLYCVPAAQEDGEDRRPDHAAQARYAALFPALVMLRPRTEFPGAKPYAVGLSEGAHQHRTQIDSLVKAHTAMVDVSPRLKAALGKCRGIFARLALTFHLIELADANAQGINPAPMPTVISEQTAGRAASYLRDILLPHLLRAEALLFLTPQTGHARWVAGYILANEAARDAGRVTLRDLTRAYGALRAPERRREMLDVMATLEVMGWVAPEPTDNPARQPAGWFVNPKLHKTFAEAAAAERERRKRAQAETTELARQAYARKHS